MQDVVDRVVEQLAVVADHQGGARIALQPRLQPQRAFQVEIVGRLVQQQQVGLGEQGGGQRHAHTPAAGELRHRPAQVGVGETQAAEDFRRPGRGCVGPDLEQPAVDLAQALGRGGLQLGQQVGALLVGGQDGVQQRHGRCGVFLRHRGDAARARGEDVARERRQFAQDQLEQGGLAHAVAADQAHLGSVGNARGRVVEELSPPGVEREIVDQQHVERLMSCLGPRENPLRVCEAGRKAAYPPPS